MNPYTLYPLSEQRSATLDCPVGMEISIAAYQAADAIAAGTTHLAGAIARWNKRRRAVAELSGLSDHMLADIGVARGEIRNLVDGLLDAPTARPNRRPRLVAETAPARPVSLAAANDDVAGIAA